VLPYKLADWLSECRPGLFREELIKKFEVPGVLIKHVAFGQGKRGVWPYEDADNDPDADRPSALEERYPRICFDILRGLNIINEITTNEIWCGDRVVIISYDELTPLGVEFFSLCNSGTRVLPKQGNSWLAERGWEWIER
jgi:hypothetical protein